MRENGRRNQSISVKMFIMRSICWWSICVSAFFFTISMTRWLKLKSYAEAIAFGNKDRNYVTLTNIKSKSKPKQWSSSSMNKNRNNVFMSRDYAIDFHFSCIVPIHKIKRFNSIQSSQLNFYTPFRSQQC